MNKELEEKLKELKENIGKIDDIAREKYQDAVKYFETHQSDEIKAELKSLIDKGIAEFKDDLDEGIADVKEGYTKTVSDLKEKYGDKIDDVKEDVDEAIDDLKSGWNDLKKKFNL